MDSKFTIRELRESEKIQLEDFLYEAIYIPPGAERPNRSILKLPELARYVKNFGSKDDLCLVAESDGKLAGAIWTRIFTVMEPGYGFVDSQTPEVSMSVLPAFRKKGMGTRLLKLMLEKLRYHKYQQVSLSVDKDNFAFGMYKKMGFVVCDDSDKSAIMVKVLNKS